MFQKILSSALLGLEAVPVYVEADVSDGLPLFAMVGSLGLRVKEAQDRVRTALKNMDLPLPPKRITINLSPADIHKDGSRYDLAIALAILMSQGLLPPQSLEGVMVVGELSLGGHINGIPGVLGTVMAAKKMGCRACLIPRANLQEGSLLDGIRLVGAETLKEAVRAVRDGLSHDDHLSLEYPTLNDYREDFADISGQYMVKRAALMAAAGFHNLLMMGPPGSGKTMVARRMPSILPPLTREESLEITQIYSVSGLLKTDNAVITQRPFRAPHHTVTAKALSGGGLVPKPGEITLSHRGILFLDEMPEFSRESLETLRQPLEDREITIARTTGHYRFPANFLLVAALNPCPCGNYGMKGETCTCTPMVVRRYQERISKPLLDRIDLRVVVPQVSYQDLTEGKQSDVTSAKLRTEAERVHLIQQKRYCACDFRFNAEIPACRLEEFCPMTEAAKKRAKDLFEEKALSARAYHRMIRVARTAADLDGEAVIDRCHIDEADLFRMAMKKPEE